MKCLFAFAFLALVAVALAGPLPEAPATPEGEKSIEPVKIEDEKDTRDKRGLLVTSYATAPIAAPIAYSYAAYPAPIAYSASLPVSYVQTYPSFVGHHASYVVV